MSMNRVLVLVLLSTIFLVQDTSCWFNRIGIKNGNYVPANVHALSPFGYYGGGGAGIVKFKPALKQLLLVAGKKLVLGLLAFGGLSALSTFLPAGLIKLPCESI